MPDNAKMRRGLETFLASDDQLFARQERFGQKVYMAAWAVEIIAAITGLFIAWSLGYSAYVTVDNPDAADRARAVGGALPFVIIAIIEPTKIFLASGLYHTKRFWWKFLFLFGLATLTFVTFETMYNGLTQFNVNVTAEIRGLQNVKHDKLEKIEKNRELIADYQANTAPVVSKKYNDELVQLAESRQKVIKDSTAEHDKRTASYEARRQQFEEQNDPHRERLSKLIDSRSEAIKKLQEDRKIEAETIRNNYSGQIEGLETSIVNEQARLDTEIKSIKERWGGGDDRARADANKRSDRKQQGVKNQIQILEKQAREEIAKATETYDETINNHQNAIVNLNNQLNDLLSKTPEADIAKIREEESIWRAEHNAAKDGRIKDIDAQIKNLQTEQQKQSEQAGENESRIPALNGAIETWQSDIETLDVKYREEALSIITIRLTETVCGSFYKWCFGKPANNEGAKKETRIDIAKLPEDKVKFVEMMFFGSIAAVGASMGTFLAFVAFVLRDPEAYKEDRSRKVRPVLLLLVKRIGLLTRRIGQLIKNIGTGFKEFGIRFGNGWIILTKGSIDLLQSIAHGIYDILKYFAKSFRGLTLDIRRWIRQPKIKYETVTKEVEVEKIVEVEVPVDKIVIKEVPKEIIRREMVYVPLYSTDDGKVILNPELLTGALDKTFTKADSNLDDTENTETDEPAKKPDQGDS